MLKTVISLLGAAVWLVLLCLLCVPLFALGVALFAAGKWLMDAGHVVRGRLEDGGAWLSSALSDHGEAP